MTDETLIEILRALTDCERRAIEAVLRRGLRERFESETLRNLRRRLKAKARERKEDKFKWLM